MRKPHQEMALGLGGDRGPRKAARGLLAGARRHRGLFAERLRLVDADVDHVGHAQAILAGMRASIFLNAKTMMPVMMR